MKFIGILVAAFVAFAPSVAYAQAAPAAAGPSVPSTALIDPNPGHVTIVQAAPAPPAQAPVVVDTGTYAGQTLMYVASVAGTAIAGLLVKIMLEVLKKLGVQTTMAMREKLQSMVVNAINLAAADAAKSLEGQGKVEIKNVAVAQAVTYVQAHGADTLKQLGLDPTSPEAVEAIKARIETAIADPAAPTAAVLDPVGTPPKVAAVVAEAAKA